MQIPSNCIISSCTLQFFFLLFEGQRRGVNLLLKFSHALAIVLRVLCKGWEKIIFKIKIVILIKFFVKKSKIIKKVKYFFFQKIFSSLDLSHKKANLTLTHRHDLGVPEEFFAQLNTLAFGCRRCATCWLLNEVC